MPSIPTRKLQSTSVYMTPLQQQRLQALGAVSKVPTAERIRQGIELILAAHNVPLTVEGIQEYLAQRELDFAKGKTGS